MLAASRKKITWQFFIRLLQTIIYPDSNHSELILLFPKIDQNLLYFWIQEHRLNFILFSLLNKLNPENIQFKKKYIEQQFLQAQINKCLLELILLLNQHNILYAVLKGTPLNAQLYGDQILRISNDIDLLIQPVDLLKTHTCFIQAGFELKLMDGMNIEKLLHDAPHLLNVMKDFIYVKSDLPCRIELHWQTTQVPQMNFNPVVHHHLEVFPLFERQHVFILDSENNFLYLCIHAAFHHWHRLQWLIDIAIFYQKIPLNWNKILLLAQTHHAVRPLLEAKLLLKQFFSIELPKIKYTIFDFLSVRFCLQHAKKLQQDSIIKPYGEVFYMTFLCQSFKQKYYFLRGLILQENKYVQLQIKHPTLSHHQLILIRVKQLLRNIFVIQ